MNRGTLFNCICPMNKRQDKNLVVVQANIYLGKNRWAQNLSSNKWKSDVTKCECTKCCSVPKYFVGWHLFSIQFLPFVPMDHFPALVSPGHCPLGRQWKSSELLHSTPSASVTLTQLLLYIISIFITGSLQSFCTQNSPSSSTTTSPIFEYRYFNISLSVEVLRFLLYNRCLLPLV